MRILSFLSYWLFASLSANDLSLGVQKNHTQTASPVQALQIHSSADMAGALKSLKKVPPYHRHHVKIYQQGDIYATRYQNQQYPHLPRWILRDFKKAGFDSSFILYPNPNNVSLKSQSSSKNVSQSAPVQSTPLLTTAPSPLTQHDQTRLILDASRAFEQRDFTQATIYYEMMAASGMQDRQILLNLAYLYGREGSFGLLEKKIEGKRGTNDYLYAYAIGALEVRRSDLYTTLSPHLIYDKSGKLSMLCGYFFEQENDPKRAAAFYKMAYDANPSDPHILYAYARSVDLSGNKEQALYCYTQLSQLGSEFEILRTTAQSRIQTLRSMQ